MGITSQLTYTNTYTESGTGSAISDYADVYITIIDADTGEPANGNNVIIGYDSNENGSITSYQKTISGQSVLIHSGLVRQLSADEFGNYSLYYSKTFALTSMSGFPDPSPPVNSCDLVINYITIDKPESSPGATDAQITVSAFSSYLPLRFSLDNITFQTSNVFTGITGGLKTVYVTDANTIGCAVNRTVAISVLSNLLIDDPAVTVGGNISRWSAAFNPVVFTYQRKDFGISSVTLDSLTNNARLTVDADVSTLLKDDLVYVNAGVYKGIFKVKDVATNSLVIDKPYTANATGFININSLRPYYKLLTKITYQDHTTNEESIITATNRPDNTGLIKADIATFLQSLVRVKDESNFTKINLRDDNLSASYSIAYAKHWDNNTTDGYTSNWISITTPYYVVYAAKQLGERYGGNLAAYVPFANGTPLAKWVTDFVEPAYSNNYPFDIGFIYSEHLLGLDLYCELTLLDINRAPLPGGLQTSYLLNEDGSWLLTQDESKYIIANQTISNAPLAEQLGLNRLLVNSNFPDEAYYFTIALKYNEGDAIHTITQTQTVRIDKAGDDQSVYLRWIGLSGSWNYFRFVYNQEVSLDVQNATIIKNYVSDWENQDSIEDVISKTAGQKMKVIAEDLSVSDIKGLQSIKYSPKVQMLVSKNPVKWQTVVLNTATFSEYETRNGQAPFSVTFNLPAINIQTQ